MANQLTKLCVYLKTIILTSLVPLSNGGLWNIGSLSLISKMVIWTCAVAVSCFSGVCGLSVARTWSKKAGCVSRSILFVVFT